MCVRGGRGEEGGHIFYLKRIPDSFHQPSPPAMFGQPIKFTGC